MPKLLFNYTELVQKNEFYKLSRDLLEEELSIITGIIEEIPTAEQYDNIHTNRNRILETLAAASEVRGENYYLVKSPRHETQGTVLYGMLTLKQAQRLMVKLALKDGMRDETPQDFDDWNMNDNWNMDTMNYYLAIVTLKGTDDED